MEHINRSQNGFDFLTEIQKENVYHLLFPSINAGLAIMWLHNRVIDNTFPERTFKESDIHQAFEEVGPKSDAKDIRTPWERYNSIISELQEYFLRYDDEKRVYSLKEYAYDFCNRAFEVLKANFDPTKIETICVELRKKLEKAKKEKELKDWFYIHFDTFKPQLKSQIDFLDRQIDRSVYELRLKTNAPGTTITEMLKQIDHEFENIRMQNNELRAAFREIENIKVILSLKVLKEENREIGNSVFDAISFFKEMNYNLSLVDSRLDRVQPKIKQLFSTLNRPYFNARVEKFMRYRIQNSTGETVESKKKLVFPNNITTPVLHNKMPDFTIVERRSLFPAQRKEQVEYDENPVNRELAATKSKNKIYFQTKTYELIKVIEEELKRKKELDFAPIFFRILNENENGFEIALNVTYKLIFESGLRGIKVMVNNNLVANKSVKNIAIWNMKLVLLKKKNGTS